MSDKLTPHELEKAKKGLAFIDENGDYIPDQGFSDIAFEDMYYDDGTPKPRKAKDD